VNFLADNTLVINLVFGTLVFGLVARIYLVPKLATLAPRTVLMPILLLHGTRHLGLMFLAPGATYADIPWQFAYPAAVGDLAAALLALIALGSVLRHSRAAKLLVWIFNVEGSLDLLAAIALATVYEASQFMGPAYWIPAFWVPALLVTHWLTFGLLRRRWS
jgi:hypothetical protein